jgi:hypothetical protein
MKSDLSYFILVLILSVIIIGGCAPAISNPVLQEVLTLPPTQLPVIFPTEPVVYDPRVAISPTSGQAGTLVQILASGFFPNVPVSIGMGPASSEFVQVAQGTTDFNGSFTAQVPVQGSAGMDLVIAVAQEGQPSVLSSDQFHILEVSQPVVTIAPTSGESGTLVQVVASGFPPNSPVSVGMGPVNAGFSQVAQGITDANGVFSTQIQVQGSLGMMLVFAVSVEGQPGVVSVQQFQITGAVPNPLPDSEEPPVPPTPYLDMWTTYTNPVFAVSLQHPADWEAVPGYGSPETGEIKYAGISGFFQINAMDTESIELAAAAEAYHKLQPYGPNPIIESLKIQGQEARLILPSGGQPAVGQYQAGLIVRYPQPVNISGTPCRFFILWADQAHIRTLAETIWFTNKD